MKKILSKDFMLFGRNIRLHGLTICMVFLTYMVCVPAFSQGNRSFQAGAHKSNITPKLGGPIIGNWNSPPAEYVHDELYARSIVMDDGETKLVVVTVDNVGVDQKVFDAAKQTIEEATGIPASHVLIASTHTHSATSARGVGDKGRE